jgi:DMSO/TMAO reductase YedYZ molybdopterin-dependent catalytic subunit
MSHINEPEWLHGHAHDPNPAPPSVTSAFVLQQPDGATQPLDLPDLYILPTTQVENCFIVSTGHGTSGPFTFAGVTLADLLVAQLPATLAWQAVDVISADGFGTRLSAQEILSPTIRPILLSYAINGVPMTREQGLLRLIVPSETDDALRQVKWVARIEVHAQD